MPGRLSPLVLHTGLNFVSQGFLSASMLVTSMLASRALGQSDRGILALLLLVPAILHLLVDLGLEQGLTMKVASGSLAPDRRAVGRGLAGHACIGIAVAGAVVTAVSLAGGPLAVLGGRNSPLTVAACALAVVQRDLTGLLYGYQRIPAVAITRVAGGVTVAAVTAVLFWLGRTSVTEYFAIYVAGMGGVGAAMAFQLRALLPARSAPDAVGVDWRMVSRTGRPFYGASLTYFAVSRFDSFLLGATRPPAELGLYSNAVNLAEVIWYFPGALGQVLLPHTGAKGDARLCRRTLVVVGVLSALSALALGLCGQLLISLLFGPAFAGALMPFLLLLPGAVGMSCVRIGEIWLVLYGRAKVVRTINTVAAAVGGLLWWVAIPRYGMHAAAAVSSVLYCSMGLASVAMVRRTIRAQPGEVTQ